MAVNDPGVDYPFTILPQKVTVLSKDHPMFSKCKGDMLLVFGVLKPGARSCSNIDASQ